MIAIDPENMAPHPIPQIYLQVGAEMKYVDDDTAEGTLTMRPGLRNLGGPSAAAMAVVLQDISALTISRFAPLNVPIFINVRIRPAAADVRTIFARGTTLRRGRSVMSLDSILTDADRPGTVIGYATGSWAAMDSYLREPRATRFGPGTPTPADPPGVREFDSLLEAVGGRLRDDGRGAELGEVNLGATEPVALGGTGTGTLHAGALQVLAESAASSVAAQAVGAERLMIHELSTQFLAPCRVTPIAAIASVMATSDGTLDCRVELHEDGGSGRLTALSYARFKVSD